ncbi:MAG: hypothetical protein ACRESK_07045 [Gammaproteobacteria bacterium]
MNKSGVISILLLASVYTDSFSDNCPSPEKIQDRKLSQNYEWTVDEKTTLQNLLSVKKLYAVRIMDEDMYVSCHYTTDKWPVKLDVTPASGSCKSLPRGNNWKKTESGQVVCLEKDVNKCEFSFVCDKER